MNVCKRDDTIVVASGAGEVTTSIPLHGLITMIGVLPPAPAAAVDYDIQILDEAGYLLYAENDLVGNTTISLEKLCNSRITVKISGASSDGSFSVRLYARG